MAERLANLGYLALKKQTAPLSPITPDDYVPYYDTSLSTKGNFVPIQPAYGNKAATFATIRGQRSHKGDITIMAEPNTIARFLDSMYSLTNTTGSNPYTRQFDYNGGSGNPYTVDISSGNVVTRYIGVQASKIAPSFNKNEMQAKVSLSALASFEGRVIASISGSGPYTVALKTDRDPNATLGLTVGDLIRFYHNGSAVIDATVASVTDGVSFTTTTNVSSLVAGDMIYLRPATPAFNLLDSFTWAKTEFHFAADAASALSAAQLHVESGSAYELIHAFNSDDGEQRSGSFDPITLVRKNADATLSVKKYFDTPDDIAAFNTMSKSACVIRHFAGANNQYELRIIFKNLTTDGDIIPQYKANEIAYSNLKFDVNYDQTDGMSYQIISINGLSSL